MNNRETSGETPWMEEFENLYILTYQILYRHGKLIFSQEDKVRELLILTYTEAYQRKDQLQKEKSQLDWLIKRSDFWAETKLEATKEMIEGSYAEEKMQTKEAKKEYVVNLDETSLLLEIEDRIGVQEESEEKNQIPVLQSVLQGLFSVIIFLLAVMALVFGVSKVKRQFDVLQEPFERTFADSEREETNSPETEGKKEICIQVGEKLVYLSDTGQVLYSLPVEEVQGSSALEDNPEIQKQQGWVYYLPCPERVDSQLTQVRPTLYHTLYRMKNDNDQEIEIIADEVDNYTFWEDAVYVSQYDRIQRIGLDEKFETVTLGLYAEAQGNDIYLYDTLGRTLETEANGNIHYEDRIFEMSSNRIEDVRPDERAWGNGIYYLKATEEGNAIYKKENGIETLFETRGRGIDSFCIAGDWLYYSAYMRKGDSGTHYSELYRKALNPAESQETGGLGVDSGVESSETGSSGADDSSLTGASGNSTDMVGQKAERLREEFKGRMRQLYYSPETNQIYGDYVPNYAKNNHGVIAVISASGQLSYLDDEELRSGTETTGNDILEFLLVQDGDIYCYWNDCYWNKGEDLVVIWRKVLVIPEQNRIVVD